MLSYNEIIPKRYINYEGDAYVVLSSHVFRKQQSKPVNQTKLKQLKTGKVIEKSFHQSEKVEEAEIETVRSKYLYNNRGVFWFNEEKDPSKRFSVEEQIIGSQAKFLKENTLVDALLFNGDIIGFNLPIKISLVVTEAPPNIKGNTAQGGNKPVVLETGATVTTPMFIEEGDTISVNTETGEYSERVEKK